MSGLEHQQPMSTRNEEIVEVYRLKVAGLSNVSIGEVMGFSESTVRRRLKDGQEITEGMAILWEAVEEASEALAVELRNDPRIRYQLKKYHKNSDIRTTYQGRNVTLNPDSGRATVFISFSLDAIDHDTPETTTEEKK